MDSDKNSTSDCPSSHNRSPLKRARIDQDPDYDEAAPPDLKRLKRLEDTARLDLSQKVSRILTKQLEIEVERQQSEIAEIEQSILKVQQNLLLLRYVAARSYYSTKNLQTNTAGTSQPVIHPAVKSHIGKRPKENGEEKKAEESTSNNLPTSEVLKVPRYVPPKIPETIVGAPIRGERHCVKKKLIIGNVSKWIPVSERDDSASHKWMVYVRGSKEEPDISPFVSKVVFFLHPSYAPHDVVPVSNHPFHVTRRGWGEFPLRVQVYFHNPLCKPINIIHHLKLDRSYTGLQTLGAETIVDVMVYGQGFSLAPYSSEDFAEDGGDGVVEEPEAIQEHATIKTEPSDGTDDECNKSESMEDHSNGGLLSLEDIKKEFVQEDCNSSSDFTAIRDELCAFKVEPKATQLSDITSRCSSVEKIESGGEAKGSEVSPGKDCDHDYYRTNATKASDVSSNVLLADRKTGSTPGNKLVFPKSSITQLQLSSLLPKQYVLPTSSGSSSVASTSSTTAPAKPVLVRCISKNGTPVNLPLTLFRSAVVIKPYHLVKPGESLLRSPLIRPRQDIQGPLVMKPASAVRIVLPPNAHLPTLIPKLELKPKEEKVDTESKYLQERRNYDQLISSIQSNRWHSIRDCVRVLARNLSLVDPRAKEPIYRSLRPFAAPSLQVFNSWNIGKQRSAEWTRAKLIRKILEQCNFISEEAVANWTTKRIVIWCRRQGYSPFTCWPDKVKTQAESQCSTVRTLPSTLSVVQLKCNQSALNEDVHVDVESVDASTSKKASQPLHQVRKEVIPLDDSDPDLTNWVCESVEKLGFKFGVEPFDDANASFSRFLIAQLWKHMADDLIRRSLRESWQRTGGLKPDSIVLLDTLTAVLRRPQFDLLTNCGLGSSASGHS